MPSIRKHTESCKEETGMLTALLIACGEADVQPSLLPAYSTTAFLSCQGLFFQEVSNILNGNWGCCSLIFYHGPGAAAEGGQHLNGDLVLLCQLHTPVMEHLRPFSGQLQHGIVADDRIPHRIGIFPGVTVVDLVCGSAIIVDAYGFLMLMLSPSAAAARTSRSVNGAV